VKNYSSYIGKKWVYQKFDCIELVRLVLKNEFGINVHEIPTPDQSDKNINAAIFRTEANSEQWSFKEDASEGRVALFYDKHNQPFHVGLCVNAKEVLHCPGTPKNPGFSLIENLRDLPKIIYKRVEFYEYNAS